MRLLRNLMLIIVPVMLMINLYIFVFKTNNAQVYEFKGISYIFEYFDTFPGIDLITGTIDDIQGLGTSLSKMEINDISDVFDGVGKILQIIGLVFAVPVLAIVNVFQMLWWFINLWFVQ